MNTKQRRILITVALVVVVMILFPPFVVSIPPLQRFGPELSWGWLFSGREGWMVDTGLLFAQWIAVGVIGAVAYLLSSDKR